MDTDYTFWTSIAHRYYHQNISTYWLINIPNKHLRKNSYKPCELIIYRELYDGTGETLLDKKEFVINVIPQMKKRKGI